MANLGVSSTPVIAQILSSRELYRALVTYDAPMDFTGEPSASEFAHLASLSIPQEVAQELPSAHAVLPLRPVL